MLPRPLSTDIIACVGGSKLLAYRDAIVNQIEHLTDQRRFEAGISKMGRGSICFALVEHGDMRKDMMPRCMSTDIMACVDGSKFRVAAVAELEQQQQVRNMAAFPIATGCDV